MGGALIILGVLFAAGVCGCLLGLAGIRWRVRRLIDAGIVVALLGYGGFVLIAAGVIPKEWVQRADAVMFPIRPGETIHPGREQMMLAAAEEEVLDIEHFRMLLASNVANRSVGNWGGSSVVPVAERLEQGRLPRPYAEEFTAWLMQNWPSWSAGPNAIDQIAPAVLKSDVIAPNLKDEFALFMIGIIQDPKQLAPHGWHETLSTAALLGQLGESTLREYLLASAHPQFEIQVRGANGWVSALTGQGGAPLPRVPAGDVFAVGVLQSQNRAFHRGLPWRGRVRVLPEERDALNAGWFRLGTLPREFGPVAVLPAGDAQGMQQVALELHVELTRDHLRDYFDSNPHLRPEWFSARSWEDVEAVSTILAPYEVVASTALATRLEHGIGPERIRECVEVGVPSRFGSGADREMSVPITITNPPVSLAMAVYWVREGHEARIGWFLAPEGLTTTFICGGRVGAKGRGPARVELRPEVALLGRHEGVSAVYGGSPLQFDVEYIHSRW